MKEVLIIATLTLREARRRKLFGTALILGGIFVALYGVGFFLIHRETMARYDVWSVALDTGFNFVIMAGFYVVSFLGVMLAVLTSVGTLSSEIASHTIQTLAVKPLRRSVIVLGKWIGLTVMLTIYIALLGGGLILATWTISGYVPPNAVSGILLIAFQATIMLSIGLLGGTRLSTVANGALTFMLYGLAFIGGWIEQIGSVMHNETAVDIGILTSFVVPSEAMWRLASYRMHAPAARALGGSPFSPTSPPSSAMFVYAVLYSVAVVYMATRWFDQRDL